MDAYEAIITRRTIREFQDRKVPGELLERFVNAARLAPQAANRQPLEFIIVDDERLTDEFFHNTKLANYIDWEPKIEKKARAYIVVVANTEIQKPLWIPFDVALAAENISLAAWAEGIGSCMIGAFNKQKIRGLLGVPERYEVVLLVALGYPAHSSSIEEMKGDNVQYWRDDDGNFHVPKRPIEKLIHRNRFRAK